MWLMVLQIWMRLLVWPDSSPIVELDLLLDSGILSRILGEKMDPAKFGMNAIFSEKMQTHEVTWIGANNLKNMIF